MNITWTDEGTETWTTGEVWQERDCVVAKVDLFRGDDGDEDFVVTVSTGTLKMITDAFPNLDTAKRAAEQIVTRWMRGAP